jgi:hypothetical protein
MDDPVYIMIEVEVEWLVGPEQTPEQIRAHLAQMLNPTDGEADVIIGVNEASSYRIVSAK